MQLASLITLVVAFAPSVGCSCDALGVRTRVVERLVPPEPDQLLRARVPPRRNSECQIFRQLCKLRALCSLVITNVVKFKSQSWTSIKSQKNNFKWCNNNDGASGPRELLSEQARTRTRLVELVVVVTKRRHEVLLSTVLRGERSAASVRSSISRGQLAHAFLRRTKSLLNANVFFTKSGNFK